MAKEPKPPVLPTPSVIVFWGDSIILHWPLDNYFNACQVRAVNAGVTSQTSAQIATRWNEVAAQRPNAVVLLAGTNDVWRDMSLEDAKRNLKTMIVQIRDSKAVPVVGELPPIRDHNAGVDQMNVWIRETCKTEGCWVAHFNQRLRAASSHVDPELQYDGVHPTDSGYKIMATEIQRVLGLTCS